MCGIAGIWNRDGLLVGAEQIRAMNDAIAHRGRDDDGVWVSGDIGLGHRRLGIIDPSPAGHQPMHAADLGLSLIFNGEIHNYLELRDELISHGHIFHTNTDTEVVLASYAQWGLECFEKFNGMWAIAMWDKRKTELILARDRFGIKPLVYAMIGRDVIFASEAKAILAVRPDLNRPNWKQVHSYLAQSVTDIGPETFFRDIHSLPCGHSLKITLSGETMIRNWQFQPGQETPRKDAGRELRHLLTDAVRLRLRSDAPLGVWLSGGLDSSIIALLAAQISTKPVRCFSQRYDQYPRFDESDYINAVVEASPQIEVEWVHPNADNLLDTIRDIVISHDAPTVSRGRHASWTLARETSKNVRVVLSGDGADELLGGYQTFAAPYLLDRIMSPAPGATRSPSRLWDEFTSVRHVAHPGLNRRQLFMRGILSRLGIMSGGMHSIVTRDYEREYGPANPDHHFAAWANSRGHKPFTSWLNNALWREFYWRGLPEMMKGFDSMSMAHTLEMRSPFLDHRVVEFCFSLPYHDKIRNGVTKHLLRSAFADLLPEKICRRHRKLGFPSPLFHWFGRPEFIREASGFLRDGNAVTCGVFDAKKLDHALRHLAQHEKLSKTPRHVLLWNWLSLEWWFRMYRISA
ncbi:MAG TPA: asparagine synthase (glutamine-hydrolyzing) [Kiritimatiellia bacterium]|nr:asparagine synthase (glutamine-hydrolyzing) [Kiritimatiellia bacterium]